MEQNYNPYTTPPEGEMPNGLHMNETPPFRQVIIKLNYFEMVAFALAITSLFSCATIGTAYIFAGLAILFALLSRGAQMKMSMKAKSSIIFAIIAIILSTILFTVAFSQLLVEYGSLEGILRYYSEIAGVDFEKEFGTLFQ